jgi:hypothetical protein
MILAITFVPVIFSLFLLPVSMVSPCSYVVFVTSSNTVEAIFQGHWDAMALTAFNGAYLAFYCGLFYLCARFTFQISNEIAKPEGKVFFQVIILLALFSCSFLKVIQGSFFVNWTGAYGFWGGCLRFWQTW